MGMSMDEVQAKEKRARKKIMKDLLKQYDLKEEDVKTLKSESEHAISILQLEDGIEQIVLWKRLDMSDKFRITVDYDFELEDKPKDRRNRKQRRKK